MSSQKLIMVGDGGNSGKGVNLTVGVITEWKDIPIELLMQILKLVDDKTIIIASQVCRGWREAICFDLTQLSLSWCIKNVNSLVLSLAPKFTKLKTLILSQNKHQLEDNAVVTIARNCRELQSLDLRENSKLTDHSLFAIALGCSDLRKLDISGCSAFSDDGLTYLVSLCRKLYFLNLARCVKAASDSALQEVGYCLNQLWYLNLTGCKNVTDVGVISLAHGCRYLTMLDLSGCVLITDDSVIALANRCRCLRTIGLRYCQNITVHTKKWRLTRD